MGAAKRLWKEVKRVAVWTLPRTDYAQNLSDDCYHLGISVEVEHKDFGTFKHQVPTGPIVLVSSVNPNWTELARFLTFVRSVTEAIEKASGVPVPDYVKLRWESRSKEIALLHAIGGSAVGRQWRISLGQPSFVQGFLVPDPAVGYPWG